MSCSSEEQLWSDVQSKCYVIDLDSNMAGGDVIATPCPVNKFLALFLRFSATRSFHRAGYFSQT